MRVVFDTNIFISALAIPGGVAEKAVARVIEGRDELVISSNIIKEVLSVLSLKFGREREALSHVAVILSELGELVEPKQTIKLLKDDIEREGDGFVSLCPELDIASQVR